MPKGRHGATQAKGLAQAEVFKARPARQLLASMNLNGQTPNGTSSPDGLASPAEAQKVPMDEK